MVKNNKNKKIKISRVPIITFLNFFKFFYFSHIRKGEVANDKRRICSIDDDDLSSLCISASLPFRLNGKKAFCLKTDVFGTVLKRISCEQIA